MPGRKISHAVLTGLTLLVGAAVVPAIAGENAPINAEALLTSPPQLGAFLNIWLENIDNLEPAVAYNSIDDQYLVVWSNSRGGGTTTDIYARRVKSDGTLLSFFTIAHNAGFHNYEPAVAFSVAQREYLVVYTYDSVVTDSDIWARRVSWDGATLYPEFQIGRPDRSGKQHHPAVTYNSDADEYLVVYQNSWGGSSDVDAARIKASDGSQPSWANIAAGTGQFRSYPSVAHCPASNYYLIAYTYQPTSQANPGDIFAKVSSWNMGYISAEEHICDDSNNQGRVAVAASPQEFLAVWEDSPSSSTTELYARRVDNGGTPLGPGGGYWVAGNPGEFDQQPSATFGAGNSYLVAWHRFSSTGDYNVVGRLLQPGLDYSPFSEFNLDNDVQAQMHPAVACGAHAACLMAEEDANSAGGDFEIRGRLLWTLHIFSDGFESSDTSFWSSTVP